MRQHYMITKNKKQRNNAKFISKHKSALQKSKIMDIRILIIHNYNNECLIFSTKIKINRCVTQ